MAHASRVSLSACRKPAVAEEPSKHSCPGSEAWSACPQAIGRWWLVWEFGDDTMADREACIKAYLRHNERIRASVPLEQLLVWQAKDGWEPLCR